MALARAARRRRRPKSTNIHREPRQRQPIIIDIVAAARQWTEQRYGDNGRDGNRNRNERRLPACAGNGRASRGGGIEQAAWRRAWK